MCQKNTMHANLVSNQDLKTLSEVAMIELSSISPHAAEGICHACGATYTRSNARFCSKCGTKKPSSPSKSKTKASSAKKKASGSTTSPSVQKSAKDAAQGCVSGRKSKPSNNTDASERPVSGTADKSVSHTAPWKALSASIKRSSVKGSKAAHPKKSSKAKNSYESLSFGMSATAASADCTEGSGGLCLADAGDGTGSNPNNEDSGPTQGCELFGTQDSTDYHVPSTIGVSSEEEAQYNNWATLGPEGLTPEMLQTPNAETLKSWRKGSLIGRGTYGSVYLGLLPNGNFHAVKVVDISLKGSLDILNFNAKMLVSLSREINIMRRLRHRNLCSFTGVYFDPHVSGICIFMEYIGGGSLSSIIKRFKPLPPMVVRNWTKQLLTGLLCLHSQNIMHRDIKADNVLVDTNVDAVSEAQIKLVDFGASRRLMDALSQSCTVIGTPYWMAPEIVEMSDNDLGYSYKADVWSVGCTVAEMLTGKPPWPSQPNAPATIMMIASSKGMPTEIPKDEATPGCYDFMLQCFERNPDKRPTVEMLLQHPWIQGKME